MQPPRLQQSGLFSKLLVVSLCCFCLVSILISVTAVLNLPVVVEARQALHETVASQQPQQPAQPARRPLPAILHRYGMIRRAAAPAKGADPVSLAAAFPHWHAADGTVAIEAVVNDVALGLAAVAEQLDPTQELRILSALSSPPRPPPLTPQTPPSGEDPESEEL